MEKIDPAGCWQEYLPVEVCETLTRCREEVAESKNLAEEAVDVHLQATTWFTKMDTLEPALAKNSFVRFEWPSSCFAPLTLTSTLMGRAAVEDIEGNEDNEVEVKEEEERQREETKTHSRELILRKSS